jgi:hypothetical protein
MDRGLALVEANSLDLFAGSASGEFFRPCIRFKLRAIRLSVALLAIEPRTSLFVALHIALDSAY